MAAASAMIAHANLFVWLARPGYANAAINKMAAAISDAAQTLRQKP
jgi:hypothetical protein